MTPPKSLAQEMDARGRVWVCAIWGCYYNNPELRSPPTILATDTVNPDVERQKYRAPRPFVNRCKRIAADNEFEYPREVKVRCAGRELAV